MDTYFNYTRKATSKVSIGKTVFIGGDAPICIQSMANVPACSTAEAVEQAVRMIEAGAELVRFTAPNKEEAEALGLVRSQLAERGYYTPLVADIHFRPTIANMAAAIVQKVRINPGNFSSNEAKLKERFLALLAICKANGTALRIGVNHGSLSERMKELHGNTPKGLVESCMEFLRICREEAFEDVVISVKSSNTTVMVQTVRLMIERMDAENIHFPLHLGVTEAGEGEDGRIKSAVGIGTLLADGIGDTIRVSLSESPEAEMPVAKQLVDYINLRKNHAPIDGTMAEGFNPIAPQRRKSIAKKGIGGDTRPAVVAAPNSYDLLQTANLRPDFSTADEVFISADAEDITDAFITQIRKESPDSILVLGSKHVNYVGSMRAAIHRIMRAGWEVPILLHKEMDEPSVEKTQLIAAADLGALLLDGFCDGVMLSNPAIDARETTSILFGILQATRLRISKTDYTSCPTCGRTKYDLVGTARQIKASTSHLKGLKIAIMGCVVNGPGEMADADYGCLGTTNNQVSLYKGKVCLKRNIPQAEAAQQLLDLIASCESEKGLPITNE